eukprot:4293910-Pleurochrysis_carterae.AAC.1
MRRAGPCDPGLAVQTHTRSRRARLLEGGVRLNEKVEELASGRLPALCQEEPVEHGRVVRAPHSGDEDVGAAGQRHARCGS